MKTYHDILSDGGSDVAGQVGEQKRKLADRLSHVTHIVAVMSGKGGVGKSSMTVNLATALAKAGLNTGIVDADINGASLIGMTGVDRNPERSAGGISPALTQDGVKVMSIDLFLSEGEPVEWASQTNHSAFTWRGMVEVAAVREMLADTDWKSLDVLMVDLPPGTDKLPNLLDLVPQLSCAVVINVPSKASSYVVRKSILLARKVLGQKPIGLIENMTEFICDSCHEVHKLFDDSEAATLRDEAGVELLGRIPFDPRLGEETDRGNTFLTAHPDRPAASAVHDTAGRLCALLNISIPTASIDQKAT